MCGEHTVKDDGFRQYRGSPPHVRGTQNTLLSHVFYERITPACAGNTVASETRPRNTADHPRMCGEHVPAFVDFTLS